MNSLINFLGHSLPAKKTQFFGKDGLMNSALPYLLLPAILLYSTFAFQKHAWSIAFIAYALLPFLDEFFTYDLRNPTEEERKNLQKNDFKFRLCLYAAIAIDWFLFFRILNYVSNFEISFWNVYNLIALFYGFSNINSMGFMIGHEIFHKPSLVDRILGTVHLSKNLYMHFTYEHLYGHHRRVATPEDPASAEQGIDVYRYFWRSFSGSYKSVFEMQKEEKKPFYSNYAVLSVVAAIAFTALIYIFYGFYVTVFFFAEAIFSIFYFEATNYLEHYGLRRKKLPNGEYEKVTIRHSWNAPQRFTNYLLYKVQRHSDHHENSLKPYQTLLSLDESPILPLGYTAMIMVSMFPSVFFEVMDPLVEEYKKYEFGAIKTELTEKSHAVARQFTIKLAVFITCIWSLTFFRF